MSIRFVSSTSVVMLVLAGCNLPSSSPAANDGGTDSASNAPDTDYANAETSTLIDSASSDDSSTTTVTDAGSDDAATAPTLSSLSISELSLTPSFDPNVHDYAVRCAAGVNALTVTATAPDGTRMTLARPVTGPLQSATGRTVSVLEDEAIAVSAQSEGAASEYWIRCLPHDFPAFSVSRPGNPSPGYYLLGNTVAGSNTTGYAMALDDHGTPVWYRKLSAAGCYVTTGEKDELIFSTVLGGNFGTDPAGYFTRLPLATGATSKIAANPGPTDHHELLPLTGGHALVLSYPRSSGFDLSSAGSATTDIADCRVQEVDAAGANVWSWLASDHFDPATESTFVEEHPEMTPPLADVFHCNSIDLFPNGDLLVSARHMDTVFRIERTTGKVLWKLGGIAKNKDGAQILALTGDPTGGFHRQHDARVLPSGEISLFDDHGPAVGPARAMHFAIDTTAGTGTVTWSYDGPAGSGAMGSYRYQPDGAHVIGWGMIGVTPPIAFTEIDASGTKTLEVTFTGNARDYRTVKVPTSALDIDLLRASAGGN